MDLSSKINGLEGDLRDLIRLWDRFFAGDLKVPPTHEKVAMGRRLRALAEDPSGTHSGDQFRLNQLQHRFMSYAMNWERLLREREEGVRRFIPGKRENVVASGSPIPQQTVTNARPVASVDQVDSGSLFDRWCAAKADIGQEIKVGRQAFEAQINRQRQDIEAKMGSKVEFEISVAEGKVKLTARRTGNADNEG